MRNSVPPSISRASTVHKCQFNFAQMVPLWGLFDQRQLLF